MPQIPGAVPINYWTCDNGKPHEWVYQKEQLSYYCRTCLCRCTKIQLKANTDQGPQPVISVEAAMEQLKAAAAGDPALLKKIKALDADNSPR